MNTSAKYAIGIVGGIVGILLLWYFRDIVSYIVISAVLAIIGRPLVNIIKKIRFRHKSMPSWLAGLITLLVIWGIGIAFFAIFIPLIFSKLSALATVDFSGLFSSFEAPFARFEEFLEQYFSINTSTLSLTDTMASYVENWFSLGTLNNIIGSVVAGVADSVIALFSITFITFFFLKDDDQFLRIILALAPTKYEENVKHALDSISKLLSRYFIGILAESTIVMLIVSISLICCGFSANNAFFIGLIIGVLNIIPYIGPWLGFGISMVVSIAFIGADMSLTFVLLSLAITILGAQMIDNLLLQPLLYSNSVNAHPLEIFIVILMAGHFAGVIGMLFAIPTYTVLRVIAKEFFNNFKLVQKLTSKI